MYGTKNITDVFSQQGFVSVTIIMYESYLTCPTFIVL